MDKLTGIREEIEDYREWAQIIGGDIPTRSIVDNKLSSVDSRMLDAGGEKLAAAADTIERLLALFSSQDSGSPPDHAPPAGFVGHPTEPERFVFSQSTTRDGRLTHQIQSYVVFDSRWSWWRRALVRRLAWALRHATKESPNV